jgi:hypothetical protein
MVENFAMGEKKKNGDFADSRLQTTDGSREGFKLTLCVLCASFAFFAVNFIAKDAKKTSNSWRGV